MGAVAEKGGGKAERAAKKGRALRLSLREPECWSSPAKHSSHGRLRSVALVRESLPALTVRVRLRQVALDSLPVPSARRPNNQPPVIL